MIVINYDDIDPFMDSILCHRITYLLCINCEGIEWELLNIYLQEDISRWMLLKLDGQAIAHCLRLLERNNLIKQMHKKDEELIECEKTITDKRVKNKTKYCLKQGRGAIQNIIKATPALCQLLSQHLLSQNHLITTPFFPCKSDD